jgi:uncharacterized protein
MELADTAIEILRARGTVPVFPLPDVVFFPYTRLPLHIFEPRYRRMTEDALRGDRLIAVALLKPGWEGRYHGNPEVHAIACAGVIEDEARLPDGRFNIRLRGLTRIEIRAFVQETPYRIASAGVIEDLNELDGPGVEGDKRRLLASCSGLLQHLAGRAEQPLLIDAAVPFAVAVNSLCQSLAMEPPLKQTLLEMNDVRERCCGIARIIEERWQAIALKQAESEGPHGGRVH